MTFRGEAFLSRKQLPKKDKNLRKLKVYEKKAKKKYPRRRKTKF